MFENRKTFYFFRNKSKSFNPCGVAILLDRVGRSSSPRTFKMISVGKASRIFVSFFGGGADKLLKKILLLYSKT